MKKHFIQSSIPSLCILISFCFTSCYQVSFMKRRYQSGIYLSSNKKSQQVNEASTSAKTYSLSDKVDIISFEKSEVFYLEPELVSLSIKKRKIIFKERIKTSFFFQREELSKQKETKIHAKGEHKREKVIYWTYLAVGFLIILGVEALLKGVPAIVSILVAVVLVIALIFLFKLLFIKKKKNE